GHRQQIADPRRALILEESPGAVPPQRIGVVGYRFRFRHRHLHRLVAGLRRRIFDRVQLRRFADLRQPVDRRASAGDAENNQRRAGTKKTITTAHEPYSAFGATGVLLAATDTGCAASSGPSDEVASGAAGRGVAADIETRA